MITRLHTSQRMSQIVKHNGIVYLAGQVGEVGTSVKEQTLHCLAQIEILLAEAGSNKEHILQAIIWLDDMADFAQMNEVWDAWMRNGHAPARACGQAALARPELKVEIIITAACIIEE